MDYHKSTVHEDFELAFDNNHEFMVGDFGLFTTIYFVNFLQNLDFNFNSKTNKQRNKIGMSSPN